MRSSFSITECFQFNFFPLFRHSSCTNVSSKGLPSRLLLSWFLVFLQLVVGDWQGVKEVIVPNPGIVGESGKFECHWVSEGTFHIFVHWYKNMEKFYTYTAIIGVPVRTKEIFPVPGVNVSLKESDHKVVTLRKLSLESAGEYSCQIETSDFLIDRPYASANLAVVELPIPKEPMMFTIESTHRVGDTLIAVCIARESRPAADLVFRVNGETVHPNSGEVRKLGHKIGTQPGLFTSTSKLILPLSCRHEGILNVTCEVHVLSYKLEKTCIFQIEPATSNADFLCNTKDAYRLTTTAYGLLAAALLLFFIVLSTVLLTQTELSRIFHTLLCRSLTSTTTDDISKP